MSLRATLLAGAVFAIQHAVVVAQESETVCLSNPELDSLFPPPEEGSCCMNSVCALPCPEPIPKPGKGYGIAVGISILISFMVGMATIFVVHGKAENFFVCGHSLPLWIVAFTLGAQSVDSNALLGNADLSYRFHFYDGAALPIGLGLSLILNGIFLARHINGEMVLTLPDVLSKRYGKIVEILMSLTCIASFLFLLAGNLVGMGKIVGYLWGIKEEAAVWLVCAIVWAYTVTGGLFSVAYTDVVQGIIGWTGAIVCAYWMILNLKPSAPPPSIGFPGYIYPDNIGDEGVCDSYNGVPCEFNEGACCYNSALWCPEPDNPDASCVADNGAYPIGDKRVFANQMGDYLALSPFPNAIFWNWCTILILGFGNMAALDFQARCMAAKSPSVATWGCFIGGIISFFVGIPFSYSGSIQRVYYGPDSVHAEFDADTCSTILGLPTCAAWVPNDNAFIDLMTNQVPDVIGAWCLIGIVAASMSTADGAILAIGTVFSHNLMRQLDMWFPHFVQADNLLLVTRISTLPFAVVAAVIAAYYKADNGASSGTGYLLIVAFDLVLATVVPSLFGCFYAKNPRPNAALLSFLVGIIIRIVLEFVLPKDGWLLLPYDQPEFYDYGAASSANVPVFIDAPANATWDPEDPAQACDQAQFEDYTGVDSLAAFAASILTFVTVQYLENTRGQLFDLGAWNVGYDKQLDEEDEYPPDKPDVYSSMYFNTKPADENDDKELDKAVAADETAVEDTVTGEIEITPDDDEAMDA